MVQRKRINHKRIDRTMRRINMIINTNNRKVIKILQHQITIGSRMAITTDKEREEKSIYYIQ